MFEKIRLFLWALMVVGLWTLVFVFIDAINKQPKCEGTYYAYNEYEFCVTGNQLHSYQNAEVPAWYLEAIINNQ